MKLHYFLISHFGVENKRSLNKPKPYAMTAKAKTRKQIAFEYGISTKTLKKWFEKEGIILNGGLITPMQLQTIYRKFGEPKVSHLFQKFPILHFVKQETNCNLAEL